MKLNLSLKQSWTLIVLFSVLVPILIVVSWYGFAAYRFQLDSALTIEQQANESLEIQIESEVTRYKTLLRNKSDALALLLNTANTPERARSINKLLSAIVNREDAIHEALVLSPEAEVIAIYDPNAGLVTNTVLTENLKRVAKQHWELDGGFDYPEILIPSQGREHIGAPKLHEGNIAFSIAVPISTSPVKGILLVLIDVNYLWPDEKIMENHGVGIEVTRDYMIDPRGVLLTRIDGSEYKPNDLITHIEITRTALINKAWPADKAYIGVNNQPVYGTLTNIPSLNWTLISEVIVSEITNPIWISLLKILFITLFGVILFIWFILYLANKTLQPIQNASVAIDNVAQGQYNTSLLPVGIRELDTMTSGINRMTLAREKAEANLISKEQEQRQMLNSMVNAVISINEDGIILSFNTAAEKLFGYSAKEIIGQNIDKLMPEPYSSQHTSYLKRYVKTGEAHIIGISQDVDILGLHKNQEAFPIRLQISQLPDTTDGKKRFIGSCIDLTKIKQQEEQLRRSQKMEALGKLTGGIAHDYNNMLGVVMGYAKLLERPLKEQPKLRAYAEEIHHAGQRGADLTKKLLSFSNSQSSETISLNINTLLENTQDMLRKTLTVRIKLKLELDNNLWSILINENELEDAILNMSINAMHAMEGMTSGAQLTIKTCNKSLGRTDALALGLETGEYIQLVITDTGKGIDEKIKEQIFDPFFTTKGEQGTGLGLSQVIGFMERSNGSIDVTSQLGEGTRFNLYFPRHNKDGNEKNDIKPTMSDLTGSETVLIVDDEKSLRDLCSEILTHNGYKTFTAESAQQALEIIKNKNIDLMISDVLMPDTDGYQLAKIVQIQHPDIKIQLASGFSDDRHLNMADTTLYDNMLSKPYASQALLERVRSLLDN